MCNIVGSGTNNIEESSEESKNSSIELNIGVFFDGTLNSMANIDERKGLDDYLSVNSSSSATRARSKRHSKNNSYGSEYTNVARFYTCFKDELDKFIIPIYVEGAGTKPREIGKAIDFSSDPAKKKTKSGCEYENSEMSLDKFIEANNGFISCSDDTLGSALGIGLFGVKKKVESACEKITDKIKTIIKEKNLGKDTEIEITLYVFGFSRGSATARCFSSCLHQRLGTTIVKSNIQTGLVGIGGWTNVHDKLEKENQYKTSLENDWLKKLVEEKGLSFPTIKVKFLGLYDTVSSYGTYFNDDVEELSLNIDSKNVENVYQICAGDEYRKNFALTDVTSAGGEDKYIIIPGAHSDIGGGYADKMNESLISFVFTSGHKGVDLLLNEGWFEPEESERTISNLYSIIPFLLMKDKIVGRDDVFAKKIDEYKLPSLEGLEIDKIWHEYSKELCDFYDRINSYKYVIEKGENGKTINLSPIKKMENIDSGKLNDLLNAEHNVSRKISDLHDEISRLNAYKNMLTEDEYILYANVIDQEIELEKEKKETCKKLYEIKKQKCQYDNEQLLQIIRHEFLHLSAKSEDLLDPLVNRSDKNNKRTVFRG